MPLYLTISSGPQADAARPILALSDQVLIRRFLSLLPSTLVPESPSSIRPSHLDIATRPEQGNLTPRELAQ